MNKKLNFFGMLVVILALSWALVSCGGSSLVGTWVDKSDENSSLVLSKDGTGSWDNYSITWKIEKKNLMITGMGLSVSYDYKLSGSTLTLTGVSGDDETYILERK